MRRKNWRLVIVGLVMIVLAGGFMLFMMSIAGRSTDPAALMRTVGQVSGVVGGLGLAMALFGYIGRRA